MNKDHNRIVEEKEDKPRKRDSKKEKKDTKSSGRLVNPWTDDEHRLYVEAVRKYGRDWTKVAKHMGTDRSTAAIINRTTNVINSIRRNPQVDYADILPLLDLS
jgi:SHAQKYF class myb-like DNA-binding protein